MWKHCLTHFYFIIFLRFVNCCDCKSNHTHTNKTDVLEKRQLEFEDYRSTEYFDDNSTETTTSEKVTVTVTAGHRDRSSELNETATEYNVKVSESYETSTETKENTSEVNVTMEATEIIIELPETTKLIVENTTEVIIKQKKNKKTKHSKHSKHSHRNLTKKCRHFKKTAAFEMGKMSDVWQVVYYRLPNKLKCFKLHIKTVKNKEQIRYAKVYGNFNDTVIWDRCHLEITSSGKDEVGLRRHFLQGLASEKGVMNNIIIDEEHCKNATFLTLHRESADQWLVIKNLLMMRDCDTGDIVVFSKVPLQPKQDDILDALMVFGENKPNGTMVCEDKVKSSLLKYEKRAISQHK